MQEEIGCTDCSRLTACGLSFYPHILSWKLFHSFCFDSILDLLSPHSVDVSIIRSQTGSSVEVFSSFSSFPASKSQPRFPYFLCFTFFNNTGKQSDFMRRRSNK